MDQDTTTREEEEEEEVLRDLLTRSIKGSSWLIEEWAGATQQFEHLPLLSGCHLRH
jgi:hypothetical protein